MMVARGKSNQEIADDLRISVNTVKAHLPAIYLKLVISSRRELERFLNR